MQKEQKVKRNWWRILSPCTLVSAILIVVTIYSLLIMNEGDGWSYLGAILFSVFALVLMTFDGILKVWVMPRNLYLWIIEIVVVITIPIWFQHFAS